ncbi:MAG TPA: inositol monophosphatase family protein [Actinomycetota bacterium]|nr:inositol monophosphatase family protein [Actinomycetota bacterium]
MGDWSRELEFARDAAALGARVAHAHFRRAPETRRKADGTWVTEADWKAEAQIRLRIARAFPEHNVLGEEEGLTAAGGGPAVDGAPTWVVDPIDGTSNFVAGIPVWATLVGLRVGDDSVVGACHAPALGEVYDAATGLGARMNDEPVRVAPVDRLGDAMVLTSGPESFFDAGLTPFLNELLARCDRSRGFGDFWGHVLVARGAAHVMVEPSLSLWDVCALEPIVAEAGGRVTGLDGRPWSSGGALTTCGTLHDAVVALLADAGAPGGAR